VRYGRIFFSYSACSLHFSLEHIPMQLCNVVASDDAPLQYPSNIIIVPPLPGMKRELVTISSGFRSNVRDDILTHAIFFWQVPIAMQHSPNSGYLSPLG
jgi:hypothetical protein